MKLNEEEQKMVDALVKALLSDTDGTNLVLEFNSIAANTVDVTLATKARAGKLIYVPYLGWIKEEISRGTPANYMGQALVGICTAMMTYYLSKINKEARVEMATHLGEAISASIIRVAKDLP